ncbi:MAG: bifunctional diaminohydroxyphosphoribosylaminopyrimidine deaminase/5-amino-6-(5-phosphoribosylamino)uracil reductase RibD [Acidimicrobiia bacterium]
MTTDPALLLQRAIDLAGAHHPHPNPRVGAVVVDPAGRIIGEGAHIAPGEAHAERVALAAAGTRSTGSTMVVSLEPCVHHGRTPPCTDAILAAGVARVIFGAVDPDPRVAGEGAERLRQAGVEVVGPLDQHLVESVDPGYFHHRRTGLPLLTLKAATTLDGQIAALDGSSQWITGPLARADGHLLRARADAVMVGAGTVRADDPELTVHLDGHSGHQPVPVVVTAGGPLPDRARLWARGALVLVAPGRAVPDGAEAVEVSTVPGGGLDLRSGMAELARRGLLDILVEGGGRLAASLWSAGLVEQGVLYLAGMLAGGRGRPVFDRVWDTLTAGTPVEIVEVSRLGRDLRIEWRKAG